MTPNAEADLAHALPSGSSGSESGAAAAPPPGPDSSTAVTRFLSEEDEVREATTIASTFVAGVMATAVADYIAALHDDNHDSAQRRLVSAAQVRAHASHSLVFSITLTSPGMFLPPTVREAGMPVAIGFCI